MTSFHVGSLSAMPCARPGVVSRAFICCPRYRGTPKPVRRQGRAVRVYLYGLPSLSYPVKTMNGSRIFAGLAAVMLALAAAQAVQAEGYSLPPVVTAAAGGSGFQFRPFGWSRDGKFAWLESRDIDGRGGTVYTYTVYDAVEDTAAFTLSDDSFDWRTDVDATVEESWQEKRGRGVSRAGKVRDRPVRGRRRLGVSPPAKRSDRYTAALSVTNSPDSGRGTTRDFSSRTC